MFVTRLENITKLQKQWADKEKELANLSFSVADVKIWIDSECKNLTKSASNQKQGKPSIPFL